MAVLEVSIIHGGCSLFTRKYIQVDSMDEDVVSAAMYTAFLSLSNVMGRSDLDQIKMEIGASSMHVLHVVARLLPGKEHDFYIYVIVDKALSKKRARAFLTRVFNSLVERHGKDLPGCIQDHSPVDGFDDVVDAIVKAEKKM